MIKQILASFLQDEITRIAELEARKKTRDLVKVEWGVKKDIHGRDKGFVEKIYLDFGPTRIYINDFTVEGVGREW